MEHQAVFSQSVGGAECQKLIMIILRLKSLEQEASLHLDVLVEGPSQFLPPLRGGGLSHARLLVLVPVPQVTEHSE